jgi:hypothetical protein
LPRGIVAHRVGIDRHFNASLSPGADLTGAGNENALAELDQLLAPIALYPADALLSQVLMASTYLLEIVEAARWSHSPTSCRGWMKNWSGHDVWAMRFCARKTNQ